MSATDPLSPLSSFINYRTILSLFQLFWCTWAVGSERHLLGKQQNNLSGMSAVSQKRETAWLNVLHLSISAAQSQRWLALCSCCDCTSVADVSLEMWSMFNVCNALTDSFLSSSLVSLSLPQVPLSLSRTFVVSRAESLAGSPGTVAYSLFPFLHTHIFTSGTALMSFHKLIPCESLSCIDCLTRMLSINVHECFDLHCVWIKPVSESLFVPECIMHCAVFACVHEWKRARERGKQIQIET